MPSLTTFRIEFDRVGATYTPGETVTGNIIVDVTKPKHFRGLNLLAKGEANVSWTEKGKRSTNNHYRNEEKYFTFNYTVLRGQGSNARVDIPAGYHKYPFSLQLPANIPCSFEHKHGHIRYTMKAVIDRPWKFDHECKAAFTVVAPLDLNLNQQDIIGIDDDIVESFYCCYCFCCFDLGSLTVRVKVPVAGFVPGQWINTSVEFSNTSNSVEVTKICTKLQRTVKFHASSSKTKTETLSVASAKRGGPFTMQGQEILQFKIPPIPPSRLEYCTIIDLQYQLKLCVHVSGTHCKVEKKYPILIGTVPLYTMPSAPPLASTDHGSALHAPTGSTSMPMPTPAPVAEAMSNPAPYPYPGGRPSTGGVPRPSLNFPPIGFVAEAPAGPSFTRNQWDSPPPTYEECVSGAQHIRDDGESDYVHGANMAFAPRYPVFLFPPPNTASK